jgi:hypothetical protein
VQRVMLAALILRVGATAVNSGTTKQKGNVCAESTCSGASGGGANDPNDVGGEGTKILELDLRERIVPEPMTDPEPLAQVGAEAPRGDAGSCGDFGACLDDILATRKGFGPYARTIGCDGGECWVVPTRGSSGPARSLLRVKELLWSPV